MPDASRTFVPQFTVQPGAQFPWQAHPGPVLVNIVQGDLVYVRASDCIARPSTAWSRMSCQRTVWKVVEIGRHAVSTHTQART